ncbi:profilin [Phlyctema vagabunda]|uniref:Profilin n=1 Tax=Phlyctema vagabunda TaxID=108571 RepID=A0ABR4PA23_9HELO
MTPLCLAKLTGLVEQHMLIPGMATAEICPSGHLDKGAIMSAAGDSVWASSPGFSVAPAEIKEVISALGGSVDKLYSDGLHIAGERFVVTKAEGRSIYARKGREGVVIVKTTQAILVAHYGENAIAGNAAVTVEQLADYLAGLGY